METNLRSTFIDQIAEGISVPGLGRAHFDDEETKRRWTKKLKGKSLLDVYGNHPVLRTYLEYHRNTKGKHMTLEGRPYLLDILIDSSPEVVIKKSVQCGISEIALCISYTNAGMGLSVLYTLPSQPLRNRFVASRVDKHLSRIPYYRALVSHASAFHAKVSDARALKDFGSGMLFFVGSNTAGEFSEFPADILIVDEQDLCDPENLGLAKDRLSESEIKRIWRVGNPRVATSPQSIGRAFDRSDAKEWFVRCKCGHQQTLEWFRHFVTKLKGGNYKLKDKKGQPVCVECDKPFDRLGSGKWKATNPKGRGSGYHISKLFTPSADIMELFGTFTEASYDHTKLTIFYGSELGLYYVPKSAKLTYDDLMACIPEELYEWAEHEEVVEDKYGNEKTISHTVVMGVDVGAVLHVKASIIDEDDCRVAARIETLAGWGELQELCDELNPDVVVIDAQPEVHKVAEFAEDSGHNVWVCRFGSQELTKPMTLDWDKEPKVIMANRTAVFDGAFASIKKGEMLLPACAEFVDDFFDQMCVPKRQREEKPNGATRYIWSKGVDHYRLADVYEWVAAQVLESTGAHVSALN